MASPFVEAALVKVVLPQLLRRYVGRGKRVEAIIKELPYCSIATTRRVIDVFGIPKNRRLEAIERLMPAARARS